MDLFQQWNSGGIQKMTRSGCQLRRGDAQRRVAVVERILAFDLRRLAVVHFDIGRSEGHSSVGDSHLGGEVTLRQLSDHFGPRFMISLVPEGTQIPSGYPSYGGQFGSYLAITHAIRDILSFMDVQSYNTPPLQGLDGEIYQPGSVDYHVAMTELLTLGGLTKIQYVFVYPNEKDVVLAGPAALAGTGRAPRR